MNEVELFLSDEFEKYSMRLKGYSDKLKEIKTSEESEINRIKEEFKIKKNEIMQEAGKVHDAWEKYKKMKLTTE